MIVNIYAPIKGSHVSRFLSISSFQMESLSNRIANYFLKRGYKKGEAVALFMENRPEYVATWLGLAKIGVVPALINYNLRKDALLHTITVADCRAIIYGLELETGKKESITTTLILTKRFNDKAFFFALLSFLTFFSCL